MNNMTNNLKGTTLKVITGREPIKKTQTSKHISTKTMVDFSLTIDSALTTKLLKNANDQIN